MIALDIAKTYPRPDRSYFDAFDALVYLLECNYATLEDLEMKAKPVKSKVRRQRSICETGLFTLHAHTPAAYATAKRLRCMRVAEILKKPTKIEVLQNEDVARIDVHFGSTSLVAHVGSVSTGLNPFDKGWVARLYVNGSCVYVDNHDADSQVGRASTGAGVDAVRSGCDSAHARSRCHSGCYCSPPRHRRLNNKERVR